MAEQIETRERLEEQRGKQQATFYMCALFPYLSRGLVWRGFKVVFVTESILRHCLGSLVARIEQILAESLQTERFFFHCSSRCVQ